VLGCKAPAVEECHDGADGHGGGDGESTDEGVVVGSGRGVEIVREVVGEIDSVSLKAGSVLLKIWKMSGR